MQLLMIFTVENLPYIGQETLQDHIIPKEHFDMNRENLNQTLETSRIKNARRYVES